MDTNLQKIEAFIDEHHVLSLATAVGDEVSACSLFYAYDKKEQCFIVASSEDTEHIQNIHKNPKVAANILLETKEVGKVQGLQVKGKLKEVREQSQKLLYLKAFPYAVALAPKLWKIEVHSFKLTDNRLGFGKKLTWQVPSL